MTDAIEYERGPESGDGRPAGWRVVGSAWAIVLLFLLLLAGVSAVACPRGVHPDGHLAGAIIPQHDPCVGPGLASAQGVDGCKTIPLAQNWASYSNF